MAKTRMFVVYDSKVEAYNTPFHCRTVGEAIRSFEAAVQDPQSNFARWPADYTLFEIGEYDDSTAQIEMFPAKRSIGCAIEFVRQGVGLKAVQDVSGVEAKEGAN